MSVLLCSLILEAVYREDSSAGLLPFTSLKGQKTVKINSDLTYHVCFSSF